MVDEFTVALGQLATDGGWVFWSLIGLAFGIGFSLLSIRHFLKFPKSIEAESKQHGEKMNPKTTANR